MEVLYPNPVSLLSGSHMASSFPASNAQTTSPAYSNNYVPFFSNNTQTNFYDPSSMPTPTNAFSSGYGVFPAPNANNVYYVNNPPQNNNVFFAHNLSSWNQQTPPEEPRGLKRKSYNLDVDPEIPSSSYFQKKTRSWYDYPETVHDSTPTSSSSSTSLPPTSDTSKQIVLYQGTSSANLHNNNNNNNNHNFLKTLFESNPLHFFPSPDHIIDPETKKALIQVGKPSILSVWDTPDDSEPERELIKSPRIVELTEDDLDTGEEHIKKIPKVIEAEPKFNGSTWNSSSIESNDTPTVIFPVTPPSSPPRPFTKTPFEEEAEEEVIVDEMNNIIRVKPQKSHVVIEEVHDEPLPADNESCQGMDIE